jgi:hypothetical protein
VPPARQVAQRGGQVDAQVEQAAGGLGQSFHPQ